jgi:hypothetical protein
MPVEEIDYFLRVIYTVLALSAGGLLVHGAGIVRAGRAYVFIGHSGSGKTTVARVSPEDVVLNDDLVLLMPTSLGETNGALDSAWMVYATPFWNPTQVRPVGDHAPLAAIYCLVQDTLVSRVEMSQGRATAELLACTPVVASDPSRNKQVLDRILAILISTPAYRLHFRADDSFWSVIETTQVALN